LCLFLACETPYTIKNCIFNFIIKHNFIANKKKRIINNKISF
jgi:hypothetical protein